MNTLKAWGAKVLIDPTALPERRAAIRYKFWLECPVCCESMVMQSRVWSLFSRRQAYHQDIKRNSIKYQLVIYRVSPTTQELEVAEVIDWLILRSVGHETRQLAEQIWPCPNCGACFSMTQADRECFKRQLAEDVTLEWLERQIQRLDPLAVGQTQTAGKREWKLLGTRQQLPPAAG